MTGLKLVTKVSGATGTPFVKKRMVNPPYTEPREGSLVV